MSSSITDISRNEDEYHKLFLFAKTKRSYADFELAVMKEINLFVTAKDEYFRAAESNLNAFLKCLPYLKRIFAKPIIRLKDSDNILPVEAVRVINNRSMSHIASHSELWGDINAGALKPRKLMTVDRKEDYSTYENTAFTYLVDLILSFIRRNLRLAKNTLYAHRDMQFNLFDRANHLNYFMAIGKLHINYARSEDDFLLSKESFYDKLIFLENALKMKLSSPVYRHCKGKMKKLELKKTNVFRLHKDYKQVYSLLKKFDEISSNEYACATEEIEREDYFTYCTMLAVFALGHFNFEFDKRATISFRKIQSKATYKKWTATLRAEECEAFKILMLSVHGGKDYTVCIITTTLGITEAMLKRIKQKIPADEHIVADPNSHGAKDRVYLSLYDIESFRRFQQILLRAMIYSDTERLLCPFCGKPLRNSSSGVWECASCGEEIYALRCPESGKDFFASGINRQRIVKKPEYSIEKKSSALDERKHESAFFFRNITPLTPEGRVICPHCGKKHVE